MLHIYGHGWPVRWGKAGQEHEVLVYSNCEAVELFLNGVSQGVRRRSVQNYPAAGLHWRLPFREGKNEVRAVAVGQPALADSLVFDYQTAEWGKPARLELNACNLGDGRAEVEAWLVDENGVIQDFKIEIRDDLAPNAINLVGIESPGLTACVPIARYAIALMGEREKLEPNPDFDPVRRGIRRFADMSQAEREAAIRENPDYGELVCRCEKVTRAELLQAIHNPLGVSTMVGIKYRTRSMMGRCQGGYCQMRLARMLEEELGRKETEILYAREGSQMFYGKVREEAE